MFGAATPDGAQVSALTALPADGGPDMRGTSARIVDALAAQGLKPSVYLERGGRLRCEAVRTYPQVFDGIPPGTGIIGRAFATGREIIVHDPGTSNDYLQITAGIHAQVCVPLYVGPRCVGVVNAESQHALQRADIEAVRLAAFALEERLAELGGPPRETPAQRLLAHVSELAKAPKQEMLASLVLNAAVDVAGLDSAGLVVDDPDGSIRVAAAIGPLAPLLRTTPAADLADARTYVRAGCSCVTTDEGEHELLRTARADGLGCAAVLTLSTEPFRMLLCAGRPGRSITTETVELLELLCAQAQAAWRTSELMADLRRQAATDPLTGLAHHGAFHARLATGGIGAVVMIDVDHFKAHNDQHGHSAGDALLRDIADALRSAAPGCGDVFRIGGDEFGAVLGPTADAARFAVAVEQAVAALGGPTVSIGVAPHRPGEPGTETSFRADAALYAAKHAGRARTTLA